MSGTHQLWVCIDDVNLLGKKINIVEESTYSFISASKEVGPEENAKKTNSTFMSCEHSAVQNQT